MHGRQDPKLAPALVLGGGPAHARRQALGIGGRL